MKNIEKLIASKPLKYNTNAHTPLILLLFKQQVAGVLYRSICQILKVIFQ